jgi:hypothetical protein
MRHDKDQIYEAELVDDQTNLPLVNDRKAEVMVNQSWMPLTNKLNEINIKSYRKVIQQATGLLGDLKDHQRALADLRTVDMDIEADLLAKQAKLDELQEVTECNKQLKGQRQRIEKKALDLQEAEIDRRLREFSEKK